MDLSDHNSINLSGIHDPDVEAIQDQVIKDIQHRKLTGIENYGTLLYINNGRSMLQDLYEELLDAVCYLKGLLEEEQQQEKSPPIDPKLGVQVSLFEGTLYEDHRQKSD